MVEYAKSFMPGDALYDAVVETNKCLPDAVQLLTVLSIGNNWMKVLNLGRYALTLYNKQTGEGRRVFVDPDKLRAWPQIQAWMLKTVPKREQDTEALLEQIETAGHRVCSCRAVQVHSRYLARAPEREIRQCPVCREYYPAHHGPVCRGCLGDEPYTSSVRLADQKSHKTSPDTVLLEEAVGMTALHDMTRIVPDRSKEPEIMAGQTITGKDLCRLQQMGRSRVFVQERPLQGTSAVHENEAVLAFAERMAGQGIGYSSRPKEGKVSFFPRQEGLLEVNSPLLRAFNRVPDVMCAARHSNIFVEKGKTVAGTRAIPLYLPREAFHRAMAVLGQGPLFELRPLRSSRVGILVTGSEVFNGLVQDSFGPLVRGKVEHFGCRVVAADAQPDDRTAIAVSVRSMIEVGAELIVTTAGLSVDPDDVTRAGLIDAGIEDMLYGAPVLPGAMTLLGRIGPVRIIGVPACALYYKTTSFDLLLPRILAGQNLTRQDLADMAEGGLCLACSVCTFPKCPFGR
jgi:formylmethanofuran dehydrogenase subunit E